LRKHLRRAAIVIPLSICVGMLSNYLAHMPKKGLQIRPPTNVTAPQESSQELTRGNSPFPENDIANLIIEAGPNFKQQPWSKYNENGSLTLTNPSLGELSNYLIHCRNLLSAHPELSKSPEIEYR